MRLKPRLAKRTAKWLAYAAATVALVVVFLLYTQPGFMVTVADQVWSCF